MTEYYVHCVITAKRKTNINQEDRLIITHIYSLLKYTAILFAELQTQEPLRRKIIGIKKFKN